MKYLMPQLSWMKATWGARKGERGRGTGHRLWYTEAWRQSIYHKVVNHTQITKKLAPDSVIYTNCYHSYNAPDVSDFHHEQIIIQRCLPRARITPMV